MLPTLYYEKGCGGHLFSRTSWFSVLRRVGRFTTQPLQTQNNVTVTTIYSHNRTETRTQFSQHDAGL